jgi:hypothetical protein
MCNGRKEENNVKYLGWNSYGLNSGGKLSHGEYED